MYARSAMLRINHPSPLIYCVEGADATAFAENQSSIPFDILAYARLIEGIS